MKKPSCTPDIGEDLTELCQKLVSRTGHEEACDSEPRRALLQGATLRSPDQFDLRCLERRGNQVCFRALEFLLGRPETVSLLQFPFEKFERKRFLYQGKNLNRVSFSGLRPVSKN